MKVLIIIPGYATSGGGETLHQFADCCIKNGFDAYVRYTGKIQRNVEKFAKYKVKIVDDIEDINENIVIVPETITGELRKYKRSKKVVWFLSKFYYLDSINKHIDIDYLRYDFLDRTKKRFVKNGYTKILWVPYITLWLAKEILPFKFSNALDEEELKTIDFFFYNCEYAREYLIKELGIAQTKTAYVCGPIDDLFFEKVNVERKKTVLYNPAKNESFSQKVIHKILEIRNDIEVVALENMTREQLKKSYSEAKVYMDFGFFPGPERMPREAVMNNCSVIVGRRGSVINGVDVPINMEYIVEVNKENVDHIAHKVIEMVDHYNDIVDDFDMYREKVYKQKKFFDRDVVRAVRRI